MPRRTDISKILIIGAVIGLCTAIPQLASACSYFPPKYDVGRRFSVRVKNEYGQPMPGVRVVITDLDENAPNASREVMSGTTSSDGKLRFEDVPVGNHFVEVDEIGGRGWDSALIHVTSSGSAPVISLQWPGTHILRTRNLQITLIDATTGAPVKSGKTELLVVPGGRQLSAASIPDSGEVQLPTPTPGLYMLRVSPPNDSSHKDPWVLEGEIPLAVSRDAPVLERVAVSMSSCGMMYGALFTTRQRNLEDACGRLLDESGGIISRALVKLLKSDGTLIAQTSTDAQGGFEFRGEPPGEYRLLILSPGFAPRDIITNHAGQCRTRPTIKLKVLGW